MYYNKILGGIVGDIIGSTREWHNIETEDFELLPEVFTMTELQNLDQQTHHDALHVNIASMPKSMQN